MKNAQNKRHDLQVSLRNLIEMADHCTQNKLTCSVFMGCFQLIIIEYMQFNSNSNFQLLSPNSDPITCLTGNNNFEKYKGVGQKAQCVNCNGYAKYVVNSEVLHTKINLAEIFCIKKSIWARQKSLKGN